MTKSRTFVGCWDTHFPSIHRPTWNIIQQFLDGNDIAGFVFGGDQFDNEAISHHTKGKPGLRETGQFALDEEMFDEVILSPLENILPRKSEKVWVRGNHDRFEDDMEQEMPELRGKLRRDKNLRLRERGWKVIELGGIYKHGKLSWIHGEGIGTTNHAKRAVEVYCTNLVYGHHHTVQSQTKVLSSDFEQKWIAVCNPILGALNPAYMQNKPHGWVNGFSVTEYHADGGFNHFPVVVTAGKAAYGGIIYEGGK